MPDFICDKCGKYYSSEKPTTKQIKCVCGGKLRPKIHSGNKKETKLGNEPKILANVASKNYILLIMIFMIALTGIIVFIAASSVFDSAGFYDVKCPYCSSKEVKLIDSNISNQSLSISGSFDVYSCEECGKKFYFDKESAEAIKI